MVLIKLKQTLQEVPTTLTENSLENNTTGSSNTDNWKRCTRDNLQQVIILARLSDLGLIQLEFKILQSSELVILKYEQYWCNSRINQT